MAADIKLIEYGDFEGIMIELAAERQWKFKFDDEVISVNTVFNESTYAPALLTLVQQELDVRQVGVDIGLELAGEANSLFGARAQFNESGHSCQGQLWRILGSAMLLEALPREGSYILLDPMKSVLGTSYAQYLRHDASQGAC